MATLTFSLASNALNGSRGFNFSEADVARWVNAYRPAAQQASGSETPVTDGQVMLFWAREMIADTKAYVKKQEERAPTVPPIDFTEG